MDSRTVACKILSEVEESYCRLEIIAPLRREKIYLPEVYQFATGAAIEHVFDPIYIQQYSDALVLPHSDLIWTSKGVSWGKYNSKKFPQTIPLDHGLCSVGQGYVTIINPVKIAHVPRACSLLGVHDAVWAHWLPVFMPKIVSYLKYLRQETTYLLVPDLASDPTVREIIHFELAFSGLEPSKIVIEVPEGCHVRVDDLIYCTSPSYINEHSYHSSEFMIQISQYSADCLKHLVTNLKETYKSYVPKDNSRIFLERDGNSGRLSQNENELGDLFRKHDYFPLKTKGLSLSERISIFRQVTHIGGSLGSAGLNAIFSDKSNRILMFTNLSRCRDPYYPTLSNKMGLDSEFHLALGSELGPVTPDNKYKVDLEYAGEILSWFNNFS
jgi:hypothetical protein